MPIQVGAMNHPQKNIMKEISWISKNSFDFIDLTIEPTKAGQFDVAKAKKALRDSGLGIVGHTTPFLPFALPVSGIRQACMKEFTKYAKIFSRLGAEYVNIHPAYNMPFHSTDEKIEANISFMADFAKIAGKQDLTLIIENFIEPFDTPQTFKRIFKRIPEARMHLDVGHANIMQNENQTRAFFKEFGKKIVHLHASDNNGAEDEHLPIGCGNIDWHEIAGILKKNRYNRTVTMEIFSNDRDYLLLSRDKFINLF